MKCPPHSLVSACIILICATVVQACQGYPSPLSVSFLVLGVTSVIHHCRLDAWWKRDFWRALDYMAILVFTLAACSAFWEESIWWFACLAVATIAVLIWTNAVTMSSVPRLHAFMHIIICVAIGVLTFQTN